MADTPENPGQPPRRWTKWLLIASLALNLLVLGLVVGHALHDDDDGKRGRPPHVDPLRLVISSLPKPERMAVIDAGRQVRQETRAEFRRLRQDLIAALEAETYDADAVAAIFSAQADIIRGATNAAFAPLAEHLGALPADERKALAEKLRNLPRRDRSKGSGN